MPGVCELGRNPLGLAQAREVFLEQVEEGPFLPGSCATCHSLLLLPCPPALPTGHLREPGLVSAPGPPGPQGLDHYLILLKAAVP